MKEIVIKIPDKVYESVIEEGFSVRNARELIHAMVNGKVLPKGHGRLIDADAFINTLDASDRDIYCEEAINEDAPTLVEADKGDTE